MKKIREQIYDGKGNLFIPNAVQERLHKAGWRIVERRKMGCVWIVRWSSPSTGEIFSQGTALQFLQDDAKRKAFGDARQAEMGHCDDEGTCL